MDRVEAGRETRRGFLSPIRKRRLRHRMTAIRPMAPPTPQRVDGTHSLICAAAALEGRVAATARARLPDEALALALRASRLRFLRACDSGCRRADCGPSKGWARSERRKSRSSRRASRSSSRPAFPASLCSDPAELRGGGAPFPLAAWRGTGASPRKRRLRSQCPPGGDYQ